MPHENRCLVAHVEQGANDDDSGVGGRRCSGASAGRCQNTHVQPIVDPRHAIPDRSLLLIPATLLFARLTRAEPLVTPGYAVNYYLSGDRWLLPALWSPYPDPYRPEEPHPVVLHLHGFGGRLGGGSAVAESGPIPTAGSSLTPMAAAATTMTASARMTSSACSMTSRRGTTWMRIGSTSRGGSMGGHGSFRMPLRYPHIFTAGAPIAGWTDYREFYAHFYEQARGAEAPGLCGPSRRPILETAFPPGRWRMAATIGSSSATALGTTSTRPPTPSRWCNAPESLALRGHRAGIGAGTVPAMIRRRVTTGSLAKPASASRRTPPM